MALRNALGELALDTTVEEAVGVLEDILAALNAGVAVSDSDVLDKLEQIRTLLDGVLDVQGTVALDASTLSALEQTTATVSNFPSDYPDVAVLTKLEAIRLIVDGVLDVQGTVAVSNMIPSVETGLAKETTLALALAKLNDIFSAVDDLEITAQNIEISADAIELQTDGVESLLQQIRDNFLTEDFATETKLEAVRVILAGLLSELQAKANPDESQLVEDPATARRFMGGKTPYAEILTANDQIVPATGNRIKVSWVAFIPNSDNSASNFVTIRFTASGLTLYINYAIAHWEEFTGAIDEPLDIILQNSQPVAVNIHYEEV